MMTAICNTIQCHQIVYNETVMYVFLVSSNKGFEFLVC